MSDINEAFDIANKLSTNDRIRLMNYLIDFDEAEIRSNLFEGMFFEAKKEEEASV